MRTRPGMYAEPLGRVLYVLERSELAKDRAMTKQPNSVGGILFEPNSTLRLLSGRCHITVSATESLPLPGNQCSLPLICIVSRDIRLASRLETGWDPQFEISSQLIPFPPFHSIRNPKQDTTRHPSSHSTQIQPISVSCSVTKTRKPHRNGSILLQPLAKQSYSQNGSHLHLHLPPVSQGPPP